MFVIFLVAFWLYKVPKAVGLAKFVAFIATLTFALCLILRWVHCSSLRMLAYTDSGAVYVDVHVPPSQHLQSIGSGAQSIAVAVDDL